MKKLDYEELRRVAWLSAPDIAPDGQSALYVRATSEYKTGKTAPRAFEIPLVGAAARPVSAATRTQTAPKYSPDGAHICFLCGEGEFAQLWLKDRATGAERQLTRLRYGVTAFAFSPDGRKIALETKFFPERPDEDMRRELTKAELAEFLYNRKNAPRIAENLIYKYDDDCGFIEKSVALIAVLTLATGVLEFISPREYPCLAPAFSADGGSVYFYARPYKREKERQLALRRYDFANGGCAALKTDAPIYAPMPIIERGGAPVYVGIAADDDSWLAEPYAIGADGANVRLFCGGERCHGVDALIIGDNHCGDMRAPLQLGDDGAPYFLSAEHGATGIYRLDGDKVARVTSGAGCICAFCAPARGKLIYLRSRFDAPAELYALDIESGRETKLTNDNGWMSDFAPARPLELEIDARDDKGRVHGWAMLPDGQEKCPGVLYVHGGPEAFYAADGFFFDAQILCAHGMAVIYCDPRGSTGYGRAHMSAKCAWGDAAIADLNDFLDAAIAKFPRIDAARIGVTGGSYGGYMTNKLETKCARFKAAVAQRTFVNPATSYGTGDMGFISGSGKRDFRQYMLARARESMLKDIMNISAPTLILHGECDLRCGVEQADQLFVMLKALKPDLPARLVIFPGENHGVTRTGLMHNQIRHLREMTEWFEKYLCGEAGKNG